MRETTLYLAVFLLLAAEIVLLLRLDKSLSAWLWEQAERRTKVNSFRKESTLRKWLGKLTAKCAALISGSQMPKAAYLILTALSCVAGYCAGRFVYSSRLIAIAVGVFGLIAPLLLFGFRQTKAKTARMERLAASMMILSNSYVATEDFLTSVRDNLDILEYPEPFRRFLSYATMLDSSVTAALRRMETEVRSPYFSQWVDALVMAQEDRSLKYVASSVVDSMHDALVVQAESDAAMYAVWRDYIATLLMIFAMPLIFRFTMPEAYVTLVGSAVGQGLFLLLLLAVMVSVFLALRINTPLMV